MLSLSEKQRLTLKDSTARINIWEGAVRSGKSFASLIRWLEYIQEAPSGNLVIIGRTATTIKHNIVDEICELIGTDARYYSGKNELVLWGRRIYLIGASDERAESKIRGSTFAGAYVDEATLIPESFWTMLLSRLSIEGSKLFATTNPDTPYHWLKKNYIDRIDDLNMKLWKFGLEDNPSLTKEFKTNLKQEYRGLWYQRYIEGEWCLAEGTIYDFFDQSLHCINFSPGNANEYYVGIDYGTTNPCAFVLIAYNPMHYPNMWVEKEYYYDSSKHNRQKTDTEYAQELSKFIENIPIAGIYVDPSASSFKLECNRQGIRNVFDANNNVLDGIRFVASLFTNGTLKICRSCVNLIREMGAYVWDPKSKDLGIDKPLKANDHCFVAGTMVRTLSGDTPIELIDKGEKVLTPLGYKTVLKTFCREADVYEYKILGQKISCTSNHKFFTVNGWKESSKLIQSDIFLIDGNEQKCLLRPSYLTESSIVDTYLPRILPIESIIKLIERPPLKDMDIYIEMFGNSIMEKFPKDTIFITSTGMLKTMILATSDVFHLMSTYPFICEIVRKSKSKLQDVTAKRLDLLLKSGIDQKKAENGTKNMLGTLSLGHEELNILNAAKSVKKSSKEIRKDKNFVRITVSRDGEELISLMMRLEYVEIVIKSLELINTQKEKPALNLAEVNYIGKQKTYNLHVEDIHTYYVDNILVSNCNDSLRYCLYTVFGQRLGSNDRMTKEKLAELKKKAFYEKSF